MAEGRVELMRLSEREREEREGRRQRTPGKGPERPESERLTAVTAPVRGSQATPRHRQGVASAWFQVARELSGSESCSLARRRNRPSWFRQRVSGGGEREKKRKKKKTERSIV